MAAVAEREGGGDGREEIMGAESVIGLGKKALKSGGGEREQGGHGVSEH